MHAELDIMLRVLAATASGMLVGLNRELHGKPTGMRTLGLVGLSTAAVTCAAVGLDATSKDPNAATGHVMQGILTGIGFLGAGVILRDAPGIRVHGLTTAATVLLTASLGIVFGLGNWIMGSASLALALLTLIFAGAIEHGLRRRFGGLEPGAGASEGADASDEATRPMR